MNTNIDILKDKLQDRDEEMEVARLKFEKHFGINSSVRNKKADGLIAKAEELKKEAEKV